MKIRILIILLAIVAVSCSAPMKIYTTVDKTIDFSSYKTFNFYEIREEHLQIKEVNRRRLAMAIELELGYKGIKKVSENPDLLVNLFSSINRREVTTTQQSAVGYYGAATPYGMGVGISVSPPSSYASSYTTGSVTFDLVDSKENKLILEGIATIDATDNDDADRIINYTVKDVFKDIPDKIKR
ncbi:MAG: DUF4136 domain-containing protein [Cyclobacteriaceae bacterium]|nr:DUF4136 domain-containing protein [Cyclobacteriaceae bacterium]